MNSGQPGDEQSDKTASQTRAALSKLTEEARRLKLLFELQSLRENPREISVDLEALLSELRPPPEDQLPSSLS
jgi:hypothetical protein